MAALTLLEAAKRGFGTILEQAISETFARQAPILEFLPFKGISGNSIKYSQEETLPGVAFRGVNEAFVSSVGVLNPITESLTIVGGDIEIDRFILETESPDERATQTEMKMKAVSEDFQRVFFKGDQSTSPKEFNGLQTRLTGDQLVDNGNTSGGDALSLNNLDELIDAVEDAQFLAMNKAMARRLTAATRDTAVGGHITFEQDQFGRKAPFYADLRILIIKTLDNKDTVLPFTEANPGGGSAASTSIYCLSFGPNMLTGIQNGGLSARDLGEQDTKPVLLTRVEWYAGIQLRHKRAAARLRGIKDSAVIK